MIQLTTSFLSRNWSPLTFSLFLVGALLALPCIGLGQGPTGKPLSFTARGTAVGDLAGPLKAYIEKAYPGETRWTNQVKVVVSGCKYAFYLEGPPSASARTIIGTQCVYDGTNRYYTQLFSTNATAEQTRPQAPKNHANSTISAGPAQVPGGGDYLSAALWLGLASHCSPKTNTNPGDTLINLPPSVKTHSEVKWSEQAPGFVQLRKDSYEEGGAATFTVSFAVSEWQTVSGLYFPKQMQIEMKDPSETHIVCLVTIHSVSLHADEKSFVPSIPPKTQIVDKRFSPADGSSNLSYFSKTGEVFHTAAEAREATIEKDPRLHINKPMLYKKPQRKTSTAPTSGLKP